MSSVTLWKPNCSDTYGGQPLIGYRPNVQDWSYTHCLYSGGGAYYINNPGFVPYTVEMGGGMTEAQLNALLAKLDEVKAAQVATTSQVSTSGAAGVSAVEAAVVAGIDQSAYVQVLVVVVLYVLGLFFGWRVTGRAENRSG